MLEVFYILLLIVFSTLIVAALAGYSMKRSILKEDLRNHQEKLKNQQQYLDDCRTEIAAIQLDIESLEVEHGSLKAQQTCLLELRALLVTEEFKRFPQARRSLR